MSNTPFIPASDGNLGRVAAALESRSRDPSIAENYDSTSTYEVGKHVRHEGLVYKCITAITTAESWNAAHWREVKVVDELETQNDNITKLEEGIAIIVDGDTAAVAVPVGGYAYLKNNMHGLAEGLYKNSSSSVFPVSGGTANNTAFTSVPKGAVNDAFELLNTKLTDLFIIERITLNFTNGTCTVAGKTNYELITAHAINRPSYENNDYNIAMFQKTDQGNYMFKNNYPTLTSSLIVFLLWIKA